MTINSAFSTKKLNSSCKAFISPKKFLQFIYFIICHFTLIYF